jgi:hypothetical protein
MMKKATITIAIALVLVSCTSQLQNRTSKTSLPIDNSIEEPTFTLTPIPSIGTSSTMTPTPTEVASISVSGMLAYTGDQSINVISVINRAFFTVVENDEAIYYSSPSWSPMGDQIVFSSFGPDTSPKISVINRDGSGLRLIGNGVYTRPTWSPDGDIAYATNDGLYIISQDKQGLQQILGTESPLGPFVTWSPNGKQLAFLGASGGPRHPYKIFVVNSDGSNLHPVTETIVGRSNLAWSPDESKIAFRSFDDCGDINVLDLTTGFVTNLTDTHGIIELDPTWSPDGNYIAFSRGFNTPCEQDRVEGDQGDSIFMMKANGRDAIQITQVGSQPSWWPTVILQSNWKYSVTKAGSNLNVRESPAISGNSLIKLQQRDVFTVLDDSIDADNYHWRKIRTEGGIEGWIVDVPGWYMFESAP